MEQHKKNVNFKKRMKHVWMTMIIQIIFTLGIVITVVANTWGEIHKDAKSTSNHVNTRFDDIVNGYTNSFKAILIPIKDQIAKNPSFDDMQSWLQSKDDEFSDAVGGDAYDGIALTYKGGYAHSWNYGNYSNYDPNTRPWYQQAQEADGEITVVAPYVTYLKEANQDVPNDITMTIAQKYNDDISFDLDLKLPEIKEILEHEEGTYKYEKIFIFNSEGQILSSTDDELFSHNIFSKDDDVTSGYVDMVEKYKGEKNTLQIEWVNDCFQYVYMNTDENNNSVCIIVPATEVFINDFSIVFMIAIMLIMYVVYTFVMNRRAAIEFLERDRRMKVIEDLHQKERVYVDIDHMAFYGNDTAGHLCKSGEYDELYKLICSRIVDKNELPRLEEFVSPEVMKKCSERTYTIDSKRFLMNMKDKEGNMVQKTIEMHRMAFVQDRTNMVEIALIDAAESVDLLKEALDNANEASESKGNFLSNMSHEIRTPLNAIIGYLTIAKDDDCSQEKIAYYINNCEVASRHLLQIINDVLDMSSIESGKLKIAHEEFDLKNEISDITSIFFQNAKVKNVNFETHIENVTEEWVVGDQLRLNQILMNLLSNAVKFTQEDGTVSLTVEQLRKDEAKVYMKFTVSDTGIGMSKEYMSRIFNPFEQESAGTARKFGGSGLGLSITNNLVKMMGGQIDVESETDKGTTFEVTMYFTLAKGKHASKVQADYSHVRVLVVDDTENDCTYIKTMLKRCGVKADTVTSGEKALRRIRARMTSDYPYDMCIIDWNMPNMNGGEVTRMIRKELSDTMPIIIATAYDISEYEEEAIAAGANKIVTKPLFQSTLFDLLVSNFGTYDPEATRKEEKKVDMTGVHVLIAEDNPMNMDIAVTIMEKAGIKVDPVENGQEACDKFFSESSGTYDLILMDIQMPVMDGYEATTVIRDSNHPDAKSIPIIAMTANAFAEDITQALSKGMTAHISKPVNYDKLFELLNKFSQKE